MGATGAIAAHSRLTAAATSLRGEPTAIGTSLRGEPSPTAIGVSLRGRLTAIEASTSKTSDVQEGPLHAETPFLATEKKVEFS